MLYKPNDETTMTTTGEGGTVHILLRNTEKHPRYIKPMLRIRWHGHSLFQVTDGSTTIATDPHDGASLNLPVPGFKADAVTLSHDHQDHANGLHLFPCDHFTEPLDATVGTARLRGVSCYHDDDRGKRLGPNITWSITMNGIQVTHLGDLGHYLSPAQMFQIGVPDILIVNTGANIALAEDNIALLSPRVIIPMHYYTPGIDFPYFHMKTVLDFTDGKKDVEQVGEEHTYTRDALHGRPRIHVYKPPRKRR
jgi:L-ascorbate metabolism protein UlaG (beta-lactamase superfamily)